MRLRRASSAQRSSRAVISPQVAIEAAAGDERCKHCGLVVPQERRSHSQFCCAGCEAVNSLLTAEGLTRFYDLGGRATGAVGSVPHVPSFDWLPELEARQGGGDTVRLTLDVQGIRCAACVWLLQALWQRIEGGLDLRVSPSMGRATLTYRAGSKAAEQFLATAARLGYPMAPPSRAIVRDTGLLIRLGICAAIAMNAMILAVSLYFGLDVAAEGASDATLRRLFGWVLTGLGTASVVVGGPVFFRSAWAGVRAGVVHMDLPISLGIAMAWAGSVYGQLTGGATYFDTLAIFVALMLGGRFLQHRTLARNRDQVLADDGAEHLRARRVRDGVVELVPIRELAVGDELIVAPGDLVPTRVELLHDAGTFSLDWINGESEPRGFGRAAEVPAGAFHAGCSAVRGRVLATYRDSGLASLLSQEPIDRESTRGRVRFWERLNRYYALGVLLAATVGAAIWAVLDPSRALPVAVAVLVVTCPCAMGIALPLAFHLALARLRRRGVFVRAKSLLDKVKVVRKVVFDKTGTVTFGGLRARVEAIDGNAKAVVATMAASSNHPVSQAVLASLGRTPVRPALDVVERAGRGLEVVVDGSTWRLGAPVFAFADAAVGESESPERVHGDIGRRACVATRDGREVARFALEEDFRAGAADEIAALQGRGLDVRLLSGDEPPRVELAARRLGIAGDRAVGGMSPEDKAQVVRELDRNDTMMVGDGLNDAPAFAAAYCAGTPAMDRPVLPSRADFCFRSAEAGAVAALFDVADRHARVVRANLVLALTYNATVLSLSFAGSMTPLLCAVLMPISSVALVLHTSLRMRGESPQGESA